MLNDNGQYKREIYRRAEYVIPQLDIMSQIAAT